MMLRLLTFTILFSLMGFTQASFATINLSVNPVDGSNTLRFDRVPSAAGINKQEIHIRVSAPSGERYQVFQRMLEPIANEKGDVLNLQAVETETLSNSNSSGTLYLQNTDHLSLSDQLLYSSSQAGTSDAFIIGYALNQSLINASGNFRGRIIFTVRATNGGDSDQVTLDVLLTASSSLKISVKGSRNPNRVFVRSSEKADKKDDFINFSFSGNSGQEVRIYQEIETMPQDEKDQELGADVLQIESQGGTDGSRIQGPTSLSNARSLIYSSNKDEDSFDLNFLIDGDQLQQQEAGKYKGKVKYTVETDQGKQEFPIDIDCAILPVFTMNVTTPPGGVSFAHVLANSPPQEQEVLVTVLSNLHKPYQVLQNLQSSMTNEQGKEFDSKYFNVQVLIQSGQKGQTDFAEFSPVQTGEYPVFTSDSLGSGSTFKVVYRLQGYAQMNAGDFLAPIRLSLNQK